MSIQQFTSLIKNQASFHQYQMRKFADDPVKQSKQRLLHDQFSALLVEIESHNCSVANTGFAGLSSSPTVQPCDLDGLPQEVIDSLDMSESEQSEFRIVRLITKLGGSANIAKIMIALYHDTEEIHERKAIASRLYRMAQKGMIYSSAEGKGIYTTDETKAKKSEDDLDEEYEPDVDSIREAIREQQMIDAHEEEEAQEEEEVLF